MNILGVPVASISGWEAMSVVLVKLPAEDYVAVNFFKGGAVALAAVRDVQVADQVCTFVAELQKSGQFLRRQESVFDVSRLLGNVQEFLNRATQDIETTGVQNKVHDTKLQVIRDVQDINKAVAAFEADYAYNLQHDRALASRLDSLKGVLQDFHDATLRGVVRDWYLYKRIGDAIKVLHKIFLDRARSKTGSIRADEASYFTQAQQLLEALHDHDRALVSHSQSALEVNDNTGAAESLGKARQSLASAVEVLTDLTGVLEPDVGIRERLEDILANMTTVYSAIDVENTSINTALAMVDSMSQMVEDAIEGLADPQR
ncbi:hypothetical protein GGF32_002703 [Allomyces javanicus]|nr:hypothetical protein GGF32_002703 [Allomyces javanicus]